MGPVAVGNGTRRFDGASLPQPASPVVYTVRSTITLRIAMAKATQHVPRFRSTSLIFPDGEADGQMGWLVVLSSLAVGSPIRPYSYSSDTAATIQPSRHQSTDSFKTDLTPRAGRPARPQGWVRIMEQLDRRTFLQRPASSRLPEDTVPLHLWTIRLLLRTICPLARPDKRAGMGPGTDGDGRTLAGISLRPSNRRPSHPARTT